MWYRRKWTPIVVLLCLMLIVTRALMLIRRQQAEKARQRDQQEALRRSEKEQRLQTVKRISANFALFQNKLTSQSRDMKTVRPPGYGDMIEMRLPSSVKQRTKVTAKSTSVNTQTTIYVDYNAVDSYKYYFQQNKDTDLNDPFVNLHRYDYIINNEGVCNGDVFAVILVNSAPDKSDERMAIRASYSGVNTHHGTNIITVFLVAEVKDDDEIQKRLHWESKTYNDIVQGNFIDAYRNLTYKTVMGHDWVERFCNNTKFVLKVDDDTMVDVYHLVNFLLQKSPDGNIQNFLYCSIFRNQGPRRITDDKWFVTKQEYPYSKFPPYCEGFAYIMSYDVSKKLYQYSSEVKSFWIDDVYMTGLVAFRAGVKPRPMESGHSYNLMQTEHLSKEVQTVIFLLAKYQQHRKNWESAWRDIVAVHNIK